MRNHRSIHLALITLLFLSAFILCRCAIAQNKTVPGPESDQLLPVSTGYIVMARQPGGIVAIQLPSLKESVVRPESNRNVDDMPTIHALSGPDQQGRIAYIEDHFFVDNQKHRHHLLMTIQLDGTHDTEFFSRPGSAMWATTAAGHGEIGRHIALSPVGGRVALLSEVKPVQMPDALLEVGSVEIWDIEKRTGIKTDIKALGDGFSWFPDGKRLAYAKMIDPPAAAADPNNDVEPFGKRFQKWKKIPAVFIRDVDAGTETFLHVGTRPVVSINGRSVLVSDDNLAWKSVDVATGKSGPANWPGEPPRYDCGIIAALDKDTLLCWSLPTEGTQIKYTTNNSPLAGPKVMLSLTLVKMSVNQFQTVFRYIDPRTEVSFGQLNGPTKN